jgi:hypothetical protein
MPGLAAGWACQVEAVTPPARLPPADLSPGGAPPAPVGSDERAVAAIVARLPADVSARRGSRSSRKVRRMAEPAARRRPGGGRDIAVITDGAGDPADLPAPSPPAATRAPGLPPATCACRPPPRTWADRLSDLAVR